MSEKPVRVFEISREENDRVNAWLRDEVYPAMIAKQRENNPDPDPMVQQCWEDGYPYEGAIGGGLTWEFTNTSIGQIIKVRYADMKLDLTDYGAW